MRISSGPGYMERSRAEREKRVVIRDRDYYGGDIYVTDFPTMTMDICELRIVWDAYQGGGASIILQDEEECRKLAAALLEAADTIADDDADVGEGRG